ncbi:translation initiation factor IF-2 [Panthera pardus]|uniref:Translation initiation factor IF-2 n=1 Tax=Panthera pardus TaxID=9691 RepID=A0A9W2UJY5_PANPR|nr:translation initiation factor IF-2 [Panthera pardus]
MAVQKLRRLLAGVQSRLSASYNHTSHSYTHTHTHTHTHTAPTPTPSRAGAVSPSTHPLFGNQSAPGRTRARAGQSGRRTGGGRDLERLRGGQALAVSQPAARRPDPPPRRGAGARELRKSELGPEALRPGPAPRLLFGSRRCALLAGSSRSSRTPGATSPCAGTRPCPHWSHVDRLAPAAGDARRARRTRPRDGGSLRAESLAGAAPVGSRERSPHAPPPPRGHKSAGGRAGGIGRRHLPRGVGLAFGAANLQPGVPARAQGWRLQPRSVGSPAALLFAISLSFSPSLANSSLQKTFSLRFGPTSFLPSDSARRGRAKAAGAAVSERKTQKWLLA